MAADTLLAIAIFLLGAAAGSLLTYIQHRARYNALRRQLDSLHSDLDLIKAQTGTTSAAGESQRIA